MRRAQRIAAITGMLVEKPHHVFDVGDFAELFGVARSTLSEDLSIIRSTFEDLGMGKVETIAGAVGGVRYLPDLSSEQILAQIEGICERLREPDRILPGGFVYTDDLILSPQLLRIVGHIFSTKFSQYEPQYVATVETAGIPVALSTARSLNVPLVVVRRQSKPTEGPVTMVSCRAAPIRGQCPFQRALPERQGALDDDFMKAGGTLRGDQPDE